MAPKVAPQFGASNGVFLPGDTRERMRFDHRTRQTFGLRLASVGAVLAATQEQPMIVRAKAGRVTLEDIDNLRAFKVVAERSPDLAQTVQPAGRLDGDAVWVSEAWLRRQAQGKPAAWASDFEKMLDFAETKGWFDETARAVRAHIEWES